MPIYEYACNECGQQFEALVRSDTKPQCPGCHSIELRKLLSVFSTAAASTQSAPDLQSPCGSCENRLRPGACAFN